MYPKFKHPFTMLLAGPSGAGKTSFVNQLLNNLNECVDKHIEEVIWCHTESNSLPNTEQHSHINIQFIKGMPENFDNPKNKPLLIILDDLMMEGVSERICELFTRGSHHRNISVIFITQNIFYQGPHCRDISLNAKYIVVFKNPRDKTQFQHLARQIYPEGTKELLNVYKEITLKGHSYLLLDLVQTTNDILRFRTDIFNKEFGTCYCSQSCLVNNEEIKLETIDGEQAYALCIAESES